MWCSASGYGLFEKNYLNCNLIVQRYSENNCIHV